MLARITVRDGQVVALRVTAQEDHVEEEDHAEEGDHGAEAGGHEEVATEAENPILPATAELVYAVIAFTVLFALMYKLAFPAVQKAMQARTDRIRENLDDAERSKAEATSVLDEYQRQLADAKSESNRIIEEARQTAEALRRDLMAKAEAEAAELRQRTTDDLRAAQDRALADLRTQVSDLAIQAAEIVVGRNLDRDTQRALVDSFIDQVGTQS